MVAARETNDVILKYWKVNKGEKPQQLKYSSKDELSPVTEVDYETEKIIRRIISHKYPEHRIIGEEYDDA